mmetsp:Transcript_106301/g.338539  ORF Transcript_106301/g.338539 Transcript_106301/m.338539 type:complete len:219 (+) Transcript_106301:714-1370(+)
MPRPQMLSDPGLQTARSLESSRIGRGDTLDCPLQCLLCGKGRPAYTLAALVLRLIFRSDHPTRRLPECREMLPAPRQQVRLALPSARGRALQDRSRWAPAATGRRPRHGVQSSTASPQGRNSGWHKACGESACGRAGVNEGQQTLGHPVRATLHNLNRRRRYRIEQRRVGQGTLGERPRSNGQLIHVEVQNFVSRLRGKSRTKRTISENETGTSPRQV